MSQSGIHTLYAICVSHYCEAARWSLVVGNKVEFEEKSALPGLHLYLLDKIPGAETKGKNKQLTPYMKCPDGSWLRDSWAIIDYAGLEGKKISDELKQVLDEEIGPMTRAMTYSHILGTSVMDSVVQHAPISQRIMWFFAGGKIQNVMRSYMVKNDEYIEQCSKRLDAAVKKVEDLMGLTENPNPGDVSNVPLDQTTIAVCSLFAPAIAPEQYLAGTQYSLPPLSEAPQGYQDYANKYRATKLGQFALAVYQQKR